MQLSGPFEANYVEWVLITVEDCTVIFSCLFLCNLSVLWTVVSLAIISHLLFLYSFILCTVHFKFILYYAPNTFITKPSTSCAEMWLNPKSVKIWCQNEPTLRNILICPNPTRDSGYISSQVGIFCLFLLKSQYIVIISLQPYSTVKQNNKTLFDDLSKTKF